MNEDEIATLAELNRRLAGLDDEDPERQAIHAEFHFKLYAGARSPLVLACFDCCGARLRRAAGAPAGGGVRGSA